MRANTQFNSSSLRHGIINSKKQISWWHGQDGKINLALRVGDILPGGGLELWVCSWPCCLIRLQNPASKTLSEVICLLGAMP